MAGSPLLITFDDLPDNVGVGDFYNGGFTIGGAYGPGPNLGVSFGQGLSPITRGPEPNAITPSNVISTFGSFMTIDVSGGFTGGFSFFYIGPGTSVAYDVFDSSGHILAGNLFGNSFVQGASGVSGVSFTGTATSVMFGLGASQYLYGDLTFGSAVPLIAPVPEPTMQLVVLSALACLWLSRDQRTKNL